MTSHTSGRSEKTAATAKTRKIFVSSDALNLIWPVLAVPTLAHTWQQKPSIARVMDTPPWF